MGRPNQTKTELAGLLIAGALAVVAVSNASPRAEQQPAPAQPPATATPSQPAGAKGPAAPAPAPAAAPAKPLVPVAASTLADHPDTYYGESVTMTGAVEQTLAQLTFSVDQDKTKSTGKEVLVIAPRLSGPVEANTYVTVIGEVVRFDPEEVAKKAKEYKMELSPEVAAKYKGHPVIFATAVINTAGVDLAKKPLPPVTADDELLSKIMKQVGPANGALRTDIEKMDVKLAKEHAAVLKQAFMQTEAFWKSKGKTDAIQWAAEARKHAEGIDVAATSGNWDGVKAAAGTLGQQCGACHGIYRERLEDGSYRLKGLGPK
jgi:cytochrome c556